MHCHWQLSIQNTIKLTQYNKIPEANWILKKKKDPQKRVERGKYKIPISVNEPKKYIEHFCMVGRKSSISINAEWKWNFKYVNAVWPNFADASCFRYSFKIFLHFSDIYLFIFPRLAAKERDHHAMIERVRENCRDFKKLNEISSNILYPIVEY